MPSYQQPRRYFTRHELLIQLRDKNMRRQELADFFQNTIGRFLPPPRRKEQTTGYTEAIVSLPLPKFSKKNFERLLKRLTEDGLVNETSHDVDKHISITKRGLLWIKSFEDKPHLSTPEYSNDVEQSERVTIISYDIPERLHLYRDWLRIVLRSLKLTQMHQSVWIGKTKLPAKFIADITRYKLEKYIEIFEITKSGTLRPRL